MNEIITVLFITILTLCSTLVCTLAGFGVSTVMVPILLTFLPAPEVLLLVGGIHTCENIWKIILFKSVMKLRLIVAFIIPGIIASFLGALIALHTSEYILIKIIGCFLGLYTVFTLINRDFKIPARLGTMILGGTLSGFSAGISGMGGALRAAFLNSLHMKPYTFTATTGVIALAIDLTRITTYLGGGVHMPTYLLIGLIMFIPASFLGSYGARGLINIMSAPLFRTVVAVFILGMSIKLIIF
jgi:uncharacterized membrane protein YfcA